MLAFTLCCVDPYQFTSPTLVGRGARRTRGRYHYSNLGASVLGNALAHQTDVDALFPDTHRGIVVMLDLADAARAERIADRLIRALVDNGA